MTHSKVLTSIIFSTAIAWAGVRLGHHFRPGNQESVPGALQPSDVTATATPRPAENSPSPAPAAVAANEPATAAEPAAEGSAAADTVQPTASASVAAAPIEFETTDLLAGTQQGVIEAALRGNGRDRMTAHLRNNSPTPDRKSTRLNSSHRT